MVGGRCRCRIRRSGRELLRGDGDDHPGLTGRRGGRAGDPADPGRRRGAGDSAPGKSRQAVAAAGDPGGLRVPLRLGRTAGPPLVVGADDRLRRAGCARRARRLAAARVERDRHPADRGRLRHLARLPVAAHRAAAAPRARAHRGGGSASAHGSRRPRDVRARSGRPHPPYVPDPRRGDRRRRGRARHHGPGGRSWPAPRRGGAAPAAAARRDRPGAAPRQQDRAGRDAALGDTCERLLPDRHRDRGADDRAHRLGAAHPRDGRP